MNGAKFRVGDSVRLVSGGPDMTIISLSPRLVEEVYVYDCAGFSGDKYFLVEVKESELVHVKEQKKL